MKTIAFYSYKGGVGKTTAAANLARCLSQLGINCAIADLDFEAPSVHTKFASTWSSLGNSGLLNCLTAPVKLIVGGTGGEGQSWQFNDVEIDPLQRPSLNLFALDANEAMPAEQQRNQGAIRLLVAGNVFSPNYWQLLHSPVSWAVTSVLFNAGHHVGSKAAEGILAHLKSVKQEIVQLNAPDKSSPEYLILDLRAGALPVSYTFIQTWADVLVVFFADSQAHKQHLEAFLPLLRRRITLHSREASGPSMWPYDRGSAGDYRITTLPVVCRVSATDPKAYKNRFPVITSNCDAEQLLVFPTEPEIQRNEECLFPANQISINCPLSHAYLELLADLVEPQHLEGCPSAEFRENRVRFLKQRFLKGHDAPVPRFFNLHNTIGALINPNDNSRNVSFKVETFQRLLSAIGDRIGDSKLTEGLKEGGRVCGKNFGAALIDMWQQESRGYGATLTSGRLKGQEARLEEWCRFDSDVGFGLFEIEAPDMQSGVITGCKVLLRESFLTPDRDRRKFHLSPKDERLTGLIAGYIQGVLEEILEAPNRVSVRHERMQYDSEESLAQTSTYRIKIAPKERAIENKRSRAESRSSK